VSKCRESRRLLVLGDELLVVTASVGVCENGMGERDRDVERDEISD
jgi:hypothetical protein